MIKHLQSYFLDIVADPILELDFEIKYKIIGFIDEIFIDGELTLFRDELNNKWTDFHFDPFNDSPDLNLDHRLANRIINEFND